MSGNVVPLHPSIPDLRQKVDRILGSVWEPPHSAVLNRDDAALLSAYREFRRLTRFRERLDQIRENTRPRNEPRAVFLATERELQRLQTRWGALLDFVFLTPAAGLTGAAVKLHLLIDNELDVSVECTEWGGLQDVLEVIERELGQKDRL
jgi:hypothetical protein